MPLFNAETAFLGGLISKTYQSVKNWLTVLNSLKMSFRVLDAVRDNELLFNFI